MSLDERIEAWLDGSLDDAGCTALAEAVAADPGLAVRLADAARLDLALEAAHGRRTDLVDGVMAGLRNGDARLRLQRSVMRDLPRQRRTARRTPWPWLGLAAAAAVIVTLSVLFMPAGAPPTNAPVAVRTPTAEAPLGEVIRAAATVLVRRGGQTLPATIGLKLQAHDHVLVPAGGEAEIMACAAHLAIGQGGDLAVESADLMHLASGSLHASVEPRNQPPALVFTTPQARATVLGTALSLRIDGDATRLEVERGRVGLSVRDRPGVLEVAAGSSALARLGADPMPAPPMAPLFPAGLDGWVSERGTWTWRDGVLVGGDPASQSRLYSRRRFADFELVCRMRVSGEASGAEIQAEDYGWFVRVPQEGGWHTVHVTRHGEVRRATIDGQPIDIQPGAPDDSRPDHGTLAFYVRDGGGVEISEARISAEP